MKNKTFFMQLILISIIIAGCAAKPDLNLGSAPDFSLPAVDGQTVSLDQFRGSQPVLLYFHMAVG